MNQVRIIGGQFRGKKITFPDKEGLRPTPDRVKETLFNWLMQDIQGMLCLDAFAGSGSLGFEAFSRGASQVIFLEAEKEVYQNLLKTKATFKDTINQLNIIHKKAEDYFKICKQRFDLIFLDPPFALENLNFYINLIEKYSLLKPQGLIYIESAQKPELDKNYWQELKSKTAGQVSYSLYERISI